jgi:hypothetical protein
MNNIMGYIKEPDGIDFVIAPSSYTDEDRELISTYLREYKSKERQAVGDDLSPTEIVIG